MWDDRRTEREILAELREPMYITSTQHIQKERTRVDRRGLLDSVADVREQQRLLQRQVNAQWFVLAGLCAWVVLDVVWKVVQR